MGGQISCTSCLLVLPLFPRCRALRRRLASFKINAGAGRAASRIRPMTHTLCIAARFAARSAHPHATGLAPSTGGRLQRSPLLGDSPLCRRGASSVCDTTGLAQALEQVAHVVAFLFDRQIRGQGML